MVECTQDETNKQTKKPNQKQKRKTSSGRKILQVGIYEGRNAGASRFLDDRGIVSSIQPSSLRRIGFRQQIRTRLCPYEEQFYENGNFTGRNFFLPLISQIWKNEEDQHTKKTLRKLNITNKIIFVLTYH